MQQIQQELERVRDDLQAERERRTGDSERFREALAKLRESAEEALAGEQSANPQLASDLREAQAAEKKDATWGRSRAARGGGCALTVAEATAGRRWTRCASAWASSRATAKETDRLQAEFDRTRARADVARTDSRRPAAPWTKPAAMPSGSSPA